MEKKTVCAGCDKQMDEPESTGYMNQYTDSIVYSKKAETPGALAVHVHKACLSKLPITIPCQQTAR